MPYLHNVWRFNPRARTGRDHMVHVVPRGRRVSIHAPARGATDEIRRSNLPARVSIHAPARGATFWALCIAQHKGFQSTRPHGARHSDIADHVSDKLFQSTRPHGARPVHFYIVLHAAGFNPRARTGRDRIIVPQRTCFIRFNPRARTGRDIHRLQLRKLEKFQSTRPHGARPALARRFLSSSGFNPRARTGRDLFLVRDARDF